MKRLLFLPLLALPLLAAPGELKTVVKLAWEHPTPADVGTVVYVRTNLPAGMTPTNPMPSTNSFVPVVTLPDRTNWVQCAEFGVGVTNCTIYATNLPGWGAGFRGPFFFAVTATNDWGESDFSNVVWTRGAPKGGGNLRGSVNDRLPRGNAE